MRRQIPQPLDRVVLSGGTRLLIIASVVLGLTTIAEGVICQRVFWSGKIPPAGYAYTDKKTGLRVTPRQPAFDQDTDGDGTNDAWKVRITIGNPIAKSYRSTDEAGNSVQVVGIPDPAGPGEGQDHYSGRFRKKGEKGLGAEIGMCVYSCGSNVLRVYFEDKDRDCQPDQFTKSVWECRKGGGGPDSWKFENKVTTFVSDLTKKKIVAVQKEKTVPSRLRAAASIDPFSYSITGASLVDLGTDFSDVLVGGESVIDFSDNLEVGEDDPGPPSQENSESTAVNTLDSFPDDLFRTGDLLTITGHLTNEDDQQHTYMFDLFGVNATILTDMDSLTATIGAGETISYSIDALVDSNDDGAIISYAYAETGDPWDNSMDASVFLAIPEPVTGTLIVMGGISLVLRRWPRRRDCYWAARFA